MREIASEAPSKHKKLTELAYKSFPSQKPYSMGSNVEFMLDQIPSSIILYRKLTSSTVQSSDSIQTE